MYADIEELVLSGKLFNGGSRPSSPARSASPDAGWHDDEQSDTGSDAERNAQIEKSLGSSQQPSIGMGPGRTGVKGVIRDRDEASSLSHSKRALEVEELNKRMEKASLGGKTFLEEEREREWEKAILEGEDPIARRNMFGVRKGGKFGHLREVGVNGFVASVEQEVRGVWVVVHLYASSLDRCYSLDETLARLARVYPETKFLRSRAAALGFASSPSSRTTASSSSFSRSIPGRYDDDEEDPYDYDGPDSEEKIEPYHDEEEDTDDTVDTDMLPTMLVYRDGELVYNWVRVDWEAGEAGVEELLAKHRILPRSFSESKNCGLPSDDEDLLWGDEDEKSGL